MARKTTSVIPLQKNRGGDPPASKRLYTLKEGAAYLGRSEWGMRELIWAGVIPVVKPQAARKQESYLRLQNGYNLGTPPSKKAPVKRGLFVSA